MLKEFVSTAEIDEQLLQFTNQRLLELNTTNTIVDDEEFNTPEFNSKLILFLVFLLLLYTNNYYYYRSYYKSPKNSYDNKIYYGY